MNLVTSRFASSLERLGRECAGDPLVSDLDQTWTAAQLATRAAAIARQLLSSRDLGPVAVLANRHLESVACAFAVGWAGRGLVVADANEPTDRLVGMFERASVGTVLDATGTAASTIGRWQVERPVTPDAVSTPWVEIQQVDEQAPSIIQFTSGSTGRPKGVVKNFARFNSSIDVFADHTDFLARKRAAVFMPLQFAGGFAPIVTGLTTGRFTLILDPSGIAPREIIERLREYRIERLHATPSVVRALLGAVGTDGRLDRLEDVWMTGEPTLWSDVAMIRDGFGPTVKVASAYGATEALGARSVVEVGPETAIGEGRLPLGRPMARDAIRIDSDGAEGGVGELVYRGRLSDGYLDDPELNATRYGVDPDGVRTWRSGDLVFLDEHGVLHHRGRVDDMVKINGRLVEPAEAELALRKVPGIRDVVVLPRVLMSGRYQLVAHVAADSSMSAEAVRAVLRRELPPHLVPAVMLRHDSLPVNERGKVDRTVLSTGEIVPWRDRATTSSGDQLVDAVLAIARLALEIDDIGPDESLFDLGMDSLGAIEFVTLVNEAGEGSLEPNDFVGAETCRLIAARLREGGSRRDHASTTFNADGRDDPWFFVSGGGGFPLTYRALAMELGVERPVVVFEQHGLRQRALPDRTVEAAAERYLRELRRIRPTGPYLLGGHSFGGVVAHEMARVLRAAGEQVSLVVLDSSRSLRPENFVPEVLRARQSSPPVHAAKWVKWRLVTTARRFNGLRTPIGSVERFDVFFQWAVKAMTKHTVQPLDVPVLYLYAGLGNPHEWDDHPILTTRRVPGDHITMLQPPNVGEVASAVREFLDSPH
jgi:acyl-coenzyme A synthetase/AMP-(fatty) acid ligase/acyl carrier protein